MSQLESSVGICDMPSRLGARYVRTLIFVSTFAGTSVLLADGANTAAAANFHGAIECGAGYHQDARGDCQSDIGVVDNRCGPGPVEATDFPNGQGYICVPIPKGY